MKLNIVSIDCVCGAMLHPPLKVSDVGEQNYVEEIILSVESTIPPAGSGASAIPPAGSGASATPPAGSATPGDVIQRRVSELSAKAAKVQTQTTKETVTVDTPSGPMQIVITKARIIAQRHMANLESDGLRCPKCGRKVITIIWPETR